MKNMFIIHDDWEIDMNVPAELGGSPNEKHFGAVSICFNDYVYRVSFTLPAGDEDDPEGRMGYTYLFGDVFEALGICRDEDVDDYDINIMAPGWRGEDNHPSLEHVSEIYEGKDEAGQLSFVYVCSNGKRFIDSHIASSEKELTDIKSIYLAREKA